ncbi:MAG: NAD(P)/FAD-dependent oxidoreductase [Chloroflexia bacterium]
MLKRIAAAAALLGGVAVVDRFINRDRGLGGNRLHVSETEAAYREAAHRILIVGGGFGGLNTVLELERQLEGESGANILMVDRNNDLLFAPLLWLVANGRSAASDVMVPVRAFQRRRGFHVLYARVTAIDLDNRQVTTDVGPRPYDYLVIALGSVTAVPDLPGLRERALLFHRAVHALQLRNHLIEAIENAHRASSPEERQAWLTFVVGGGGDTGVELAATIHSYLVNGMFARYPWLADTPIRIVIIGHAQRLVPMSTPKTSDAVRLTLQSEGIEVMTGVSITGATESAVLTDRGEIPSRTLFWAAGISPPDIVRALPGEHAPNGAMIVDDHLRLPGHPEVFVVGDVAWAFDSATHDPIPPTAQAAEHEGTYVGRAIATAIQGREAPPFRFKPLGHLALLGNLTGVAEIGPFMFTGSVAWALWHGYYLMHIPSWRNRIHLLTRWILSWLTGPDTAKLPLDGGDEN